MTISVIIPAVNEADIISNRISSIKQYGGETVIEVLLCDGDSDDETILHAEKAGARIVRCADRNRAAQMNAGASKAKGDVLYFVHADTQLVPEFVEDIRNTLAKGFEAGCYRYVFDSEKFMLKLNAFCTRFSFLFCRGGDQTLFIKRSVFETMQGFNEDFVIMEDFEFLKRLFKRKSFFVLPKSIVVSARKYDSNPWWRVQLANLIAFSMFRFHISPKKIKIAYQNMINYRHNGLRN